MPLDVSRRLFISSCGFSAVEQARYWSTAGEKSTKRALNIVASSFIQIRWSAWNSSLYCGLFVSLPCLRGDSWRLIVGTGHICDVLLSYCTCGLFFVCRGVLYAAAASCTLLSLFRPSNNTRLMVPSWCFATVAAVAGEALLCGAPSVSASLAFHHRLIQL